jgi:hypothetical protein
MLSVVRDEMVAASARDGLARDYMRHLQRRYARRSGSALNARHGLARDLGVAPGRVERFFAGRVKGVRVVDYERIRALFVHEVGKEIAELAHSAQLARQCGEGFDGESLLEIETHLAAIKKLLGR